MSNNCPVCGLECQRCREERILRDAHSRGFTDGLRHAAKHAASTEPPAMLLGDWKAIWASLNPDARPSKAAIKRAVVVMHRLRPLPKETP